MAPGKEPITIVEKSVPDSFNDEESGTTKEPGLSASSVKSFYWESLSSFLETGLEICNQRVRLRNYDKRPDRDLH